MRALYSSTLLLAMLLCLLIPAKSLAQSGTLTIYASDSQTLDEIINGDVTDGVNNHSVYQLVSLDTTYLLSATITSKSSISIIGIPDPTTGKLPTIQADLLQDNSIPGVFFDLTGEETTFELKNLYLLGLAPNNQNNTGEGQGVAINADKITLKIDNCVMEYLAQFAVRFASHWNKIHVTNSKFRNGISVASAYYVPELIRAHNGAGNWNTDEIVVKNNTLIGVAMGTVVTTGITNYFEYSNNTVVLTTKSPHWSQQVVNAKFNNNIFYDVYATGLSEGEYLNGWDDIDPPRLPSIFSFHTLDSLKAATFLGREITSEADFAEAEAARTVEVKNNIYYWSDKLVAWWDEWNGGAKGDGDTIYTPVFMSEETLAFFNDDTKWPGFEMSGNQNVDPEFGPTLDTALDPQGDETYGVGLLAYIGAVRSGQGSTEFYAYQRPMVTGEIDWTPTWPLPETEDLKYSNASLLTASTEGGVVGDPYWFNGVITDVEDVDELPTSITLFDAYPNPFNPSTQIKYSLVNNSSVTLKVYNMLGGEIATLVNEEMPAGVHSVQWNGRNQFNQQVSSGVYFYSLQAGDVLITKKMILVK